MSLTVEQKNKAIKELLNGTYDSIKAIVPVEHQISKPNLIEGAVQLEFGVLIGITGDIKGQLILEGKSSLFEGLGQSMFGMPLEGEMLNSFCGELGNMIAGQLATIISTKEVIIDITSPTIVFGDVRLAGYQHVLSITATFESLGEMDVYLLLQ